MSHDGWAKVLTKAGYVIQHEHSDAHTFTDNSSVRTVILQDGKEVLRMEQNFGSRGGDSLPGVYRKCAIKLGLIERDAYCPELPVELSVETQEEGSTHEATVFRHPSFGVATLMRYQGRGKQFMSPIDTVGGMTFSFKSASLHHSSGLGTDNVFAQETLFECSMSFTQFAEWITSQGIGAGVPCTLGYVDGMDIQTCDIPTALERLEKNTEESMDKAVEGLKGFMQKVEAELTGPGAMTVGRKKELWEQLRGFMRDVTGKPQWLMKMWRENVNETLMHAKSEFSHWAKDYVGKHKALEDHISGVKAIEAGKESDD